MSHSTVETVEESGGSLKTVYHTIDIDDLDDDGSEDYDPLDEVSLDAKGVAVVGLEDSNYTVSFDHVDGGQLHVNDASDGSGVTSGTDVGEVRLRVDGV